jgi:hypothetical protein
MNTELIVIFEINRSNHILFFSKKHYRGQRIGKILFNYAKNCVLERMTANSTDYTLPIDLKLGSVKTGPDVNRGGIVVSPCFIDKL